MTDVFKSTTETSARGYHCTQVRSSVSSISDNLFRLLLSAGCSVSLKQLQYTCMPGGNEEFASAYFAEDSFDIECIKDRAYLADRLLFLICQVWTSVGVCECGGGYMRLQKFSLVSNLVLFWHKSIPQSPACCTLHKPVKQ